MKGLVVSLSVALTIVGAGTFVGHGRTAAAAHEVVAGGGTCQSAKARAIVGTAKMYLGAPYNAGGTEPSMGFSSMGFVSFVYRSNGIALPVSLKRALRYAHRVGFSMLCPGDVMYFQNTLHAGLSHAGIYIGQGEFIHAEWYDVGVRITSLFNDSKDGDYWAPHFLTANRPWNHAS